MSSEDPIVSRIQVGEPYLPDGRLRPPGAEYNFRGGAHELLLCLTQLTEHEIAAVLRDPAEFALVRDGPGLLFLYRFGRDLPWSDCSFTWWRVPEAERVEPWIPAQDERALLTTILIEQETGIVSAIRATTFSPEFTGALHVAIAEQAATPWIGRAAYREWIDDLYTRFPTTESLLAIAAVRCVGGE